MGVTDARGGRPMRRRSIVSALIATLTVALVGFMPSASARSNGPLREFVVQYEAGVSRAEAHAAIRASGGRVMEEIAAIGVARVRSRNADFILRRDRSGRPRRRGSQPRDRLLRSRPPREGGRGRGARDGAEGTERTRGGHGRRGAARRPQWGMEMIGATADGSHAVQPGDPEVLGGDHRHRYRRVAHPDLAPNFDADAQPELHDRHPADRRAVQPGARPLVQRPCDVDEAGHGTHVAGIGGGRAERARGRRRGARRSRS